MQYLSIRKYDDIKKKTEISQIITKSNTQQCTKNKIVTKTVQANNSEAL